MPRKRDSSGSNSSPEKNPKLNIERRRSLRDLPARHINSNLPNPPIIQLESNVSPVRKSLNDRENSGDEEIEEFSRHRAGSYSGGNTRFSPSPRPDPQNDRHRTPAPPTAYSDKAEKNSSTLIVILCVAIACIGVFYLLNPKTPNEKPESGDRQCSQFMDLQKTFPDQDKKLFKSLKVGVENVRNGSPMVLSLFSTDMILINAFMEKVIEATQSCINQSQDPISLSSDQLNSKMVGDYKEELKSRSIMIINNVEEAEPSNVPPLHSFCDTYNPLVSKSVIFITIKVPLSPGSRKPVEYITDFLNQRWRQLPDHVRSPLIARMLDQTFFLKP